MPRITLPDGSVKEFDAPVTALAVAESIGSRLAQAAVGAKVDGELADLSTTLTKDCALAIVTPKTRDGEADPDALMLVRHSCAHVMAEAIERVVPGAQLVYGPALETGFYYDIAFPEDRHLKEGDFEAIEKEMAKIVKEDRAFTRYELEYGEGIRKLDGEGSKYKIDNAHRAHEAGSLSLTWYATGEPGKDWEDLCRGPHVPNTGRIGAFKIMSLASSYWHGDENSDRLTRVYGTAFFNKKDLNEHLTRLEEAKKRDHRVLGKQLQLFHFDEAVGQGLVLWTPRGSIIRKELQDWIGTELRKMGYSDVFCPHIGKLELYKTSGHFPYYSDSQFTPVMDREFIHRVADEGCSCSELSNQISMGQVEGYLLKPMNCPHHIKIFDSQPRSYRDLPVRLSEFGTVYRWEQSGELNGMTRVRSFTVDDAHLFCREDQIGDEVRGCLRLVKLAFETLGLTDFRVRVGLRDPDSAKYVGTAEVWDKAERACLDAAAELGAKVSEEPGEAAFYGPKIDFIVRDVIGREWQLGTVQVDYNLPERFDLWYTGADNTKHRPVMIHRAPFGSMERFIAVLIEHFAGAFPTWLSPEQVRVLPISEKSSAYADEVHAALMAAGVRASVDHSNERVQAKIKHGAEWKIPYLLVVGPRDAEGGVVSVRAFGEEKDLGAMPLGDFVAAIADEISSKGETNVRARMSPAGAGT
ncbi:MAG: threonine--tRNA ligase [Phycisphaeraceae bacterium]|nr:MAG: threonine--tRNA ligase [Phycisphaeraceae bacterium]